MIGSCQLLTSAMETIGPRPPTPQDGARHFATRWAVMIWSLVFYLSALGNTLTIWLAGRRDGEAIVLWQLLSWELSSATTSLLLLPAMFWLCARWPLHADVWRRRVPLYLAAALGWWLAHVAGMVLLRKLVYALAGSHYDFGGWPLQWFYELSKDLRTFAMLVALQHTLAWYARRRQGEAHLLAAPDEGPPQEPLDRPERFLVRKLGRDFLVATADIEWIQASGNYVNLRVRGHDYPLRSTMAAIEARLDPAVFVRIHRSYLVNLSQVQAIEPVDSGDARVHLRDATVLPCSRSHLADLRARAGRGTAAPRADALTA
ncbi:LytTR family DNA-binding domain-containing protein [Xanthomonas pisi]|uniref:LytTR family transcriptional regulator n=1 Tax=Xanthomonas pisi TaxID=56457 RepID=A0A2S7D771_9XANT|nr:LytTR family DNA-binding domain-containing protein [Xanthomonas pisi]KLD72489.1 LytTR family transcriptional regulator [Xanthomonas pisi DSM 18956]PPU69675.1 LytTR family transcriptional regulator [Xanthomonas pisi]